MVEKPNLDVKIAFHWYVASKQRYGGKGAANLKWGNKGYFFTIINFFNMDQYVLLQVLGLFIFDAKW